VVLDAEIRDGRARCALGDLALQSPRPDGPARVLLRPEQLRLGTAEGDGPRARVRSIDFYGHDARVRLDLASGGSVSARLEGTNLPAAGDDVSVTVLGPALSFPTAPAFPAATAESLRTAAAPR
jgi:iron(III) transport system ATP-binding protein